MEPKESVVTYIQKRIIEVGLENLEAHHLFDILNEASRIEKNNIEESKTNNMKLYTEEQVREAMKESRYAFSTDKGYDEILESLTPIELPSDEEIRKRAVEGDEDWIDDGNSTIADEYERGAKWMKDKILNQNK